MAAAIDFGCGVEDRAVRTKQVQQRTRGKAGGAFAREKPDAHRAAALEARKKEEGKLNEWERAELLYLWSGNDTAIVRSVQGAVEDRLLRAPPRMGEELDAQVVQFLLRRGEAGAPREKLVEILAAENVGATRHEARLTLRRMVGAGRVAFFVGEEGRKKACTCKSSLGEYEGVALDAPGTARHRADCRCGAGSADPVMVEMVRLVMGKHLKLVPARLTPEERWARADAALEAECQQIHCSESSQTSGGKLPPPMRGGAGAARAAMGRIGPEHARVLERAYGTLAAPQWGGQLSPEASRLAPLCASLERARVEMVDRRVSEQGHWGDPEARKATDRSTYAADVLRARLDVAPEGEAAKARWDREREKLLEALERESAKMLRDAVEAYREVRGNG